MAELSMDGRVVYTLGKRIKNVQDPTITVRESGKIVHIGTVGKNHFFELPFAFGKVYEITASQINFHSKTTVVDTRNVPKEYQEYGFEFGGFQIDLTLKNSVLETTKNTLTGRIYFDTSAGGFNYEIFKPGKEILNGKIILSGTVIGKSKSATMGISQAWVILKEEGAILNTVRSDEVGHFELAVPQWRDFEITFGKIGFHTKVLNVTTKDLPDTRQSNYPEYKLEVDLLLKTTPKEPTQSINFGTIYYDTKIKDLNFKKPEKNE